MITSCAPMPFILSNSPSPCRSSVAFDLQRGKLVRHHAHVPAGPLAAPPLRRHDSTSRGVISSCPSQNGTPCRRWASTCSTRKASGRLRRSVEMITQRPVMGSLRSSGMLRRSKAFRMMLPHARPRSSRARTATTSNRQAHWRPLGGGPGNSLATATILRCFRQVTASRPRRRTGRRAAFSPRRTPGRRPSHAAHDVDFAERGTR